eukprot:TRINITY_DN34297_c0_g1_i1.p1 TRINITY_DN34297_c0_g1~~TRINITY_DN34297_c0_g1_i1.p1  ORF type:complete len:195 (+),score=19.72 TRINITY_DN34297_c0_g1_i1:83-667(+)
MGGDSPCLPCNPFATSPVASPVAAYCRCNSGYGGDGIILCTDACTDIQLEITADSEAPFETAWSLREVGGQVLLEAQMRYYRPGTEILTYPCVPLEVPLSFTILDFGGNGLCCANGHGGYKVKLGSLGSQDTLRTVASGDQFGYSKSDFFSSSCAIGYHISNGKCAPCADPETQEIGRAVQQECRDRSRMPSSA